MFKKTLVIAALAASAVSAQAAWTAGLGSLSASFIDLSAAGTVTGGALYTSNALPDAAIPYNASPDILTVGTWVAAGPTNVNNGGGDATLNLGAGTTGVSFLWGSPDTYNSFVLETNMTKYNVGPGVFGPSVLLNGNQNAAYYVNFTTSAGETITSLTFSSPGTNAIEIANVAVVPEPEAYGLALAGLGIVGLAMTRRRKS